MQRIAIIDIGSNSARLVITHIYKNGANIMVYNQKETLRLAQKVDANNCLTEDAFKDTLETMRSFAYMCKVYKVNKTIAVATAAIRNSCNGQELVDRVAEEIGIQLHIISGNTEAYISYLGVINTLDVKDGIIFDLGGGSTELILFKNRKIVDSVSLPFGAVNTTNMFRTRNKLEAGVYTELSFFLMSQLQQYAWLKQKNLPLIGVGGTARTVAKIIQREKKYPSVKLHNYRYGLPVFKNLFNHLRSLDLNGRKKISGLSSERNDIILAGISIMRCLFEITGAKELITSGCGLREGLFYDYYFKSNQMPVVAEDILELSVDNMVKLYTPDQEHPKHVAKLALTMFDDWKQLHHLPEESRRLLMTAGLLHDTGIDINYYSHARHSAYLVQNAKIFGLTHKEQVMAAVVAGWHHGVSKNYFRERYYKEMLTEEDWEIINKLAVFLALGEALDYTETHQIHHVKCSCEKKAAKLTLYADEMPGIEIHQIEEHRNWFKKIFGLELKVEVLKVNG